MTNVKGPRHALAALALLLLILTPTSSASAPALETDPAVPDVSGGAASLDLRQRVDPRLVGPHEDPAAPLFPGAAFDAYGFDDNATVTGGFLFIPPDPIGAAGLDRVIAVTNVGIECRDKAGTLLFRDSLQNLFAPAIPLGALGTFTFDPKIVYDPYEDRFVVMTMERQFVSSGDPGDNSRLLIAVSRGPSPATTTAADWYYYAIDSKLSVGGVDAWADYPGFEVDEEAVYITANMFGFPGGATTFGVRLWIIPKFPFYAGGGASHTVHDPYAAAGFAGFDTTTMPAKVTGPGGVGPGIGTFLFSYSGLTFGGPGASEALLVIRVDAPLGAVTFVGEFVTIADIEDVGGAFGFPDLPDAPQAGGPQLLEVNDRRALDFEWRNGRLWGCTTIVPNVAFDPANAGQTTAHWFQLDASAVTSSASPSGLIVATQQGNAGGEDLDPDLFTFFPAIAVNPAGEMKLGFSGSSPTRFGSHYVAGRVPADPPGTVGPTAVARAGVDYYYRAFGGTRNRWGDYTGISVDPANPANFWVFGQWADLRGTPTGGEDGRWKTAWLECSFAPTAPPDLVVARFEAPCCVFWREDLSSQMNVVVTNAGAGASPATQLQMYVSSDAVITPADVPLVSGAVPVPALGPGASAVLALPPGMAIPFGSLLGNAFLGGIVDDPNVVLESDESNNTASARVEVGADVFACARGRTRAGLQGVVSVFSLPDGTGDPLNAAQQFAGTGIPANPFDATIFSTVTDEHGGPLSGLQLTLASTQGNVAFCAPPSAADGPTNASGSTTFSGPLFAGGWTRPDEKLTVQGAGAQPIPGMIYGIPELLGSVAPTGELYRIDPFSGISAPLCNVSTSGTGSTEIEWNPLGFGWNQDPNGQYSGNTFEFLGACGPSSPTIPTNGYAWNGLEYVDGRLYGAGILNSCGQSELWVLDPVNGNYTFIGATGFGPINGLAWDPLCKRMYGSTGCTQTFGPTIIVEIDLNTGAAVPVLQTPFQLGSIEFDADGRLLGIGGQADTGTLFQIDVANQAIAPVGPTGVLPGGGGLTLASDDGVPILVNSADITGDLRVDLADIGQFSALLGSGTYTYAIDYAFDGVNDLADIGIFAVSIGSTCPAVPRTAPVVADAADAEMMIAFDPAGHGRDARIAAGASRTAYLLVRGDAIERGLDAWEARIESSSNLELLSVEPAGDVLEFGEEGDHLVGLKQTPLVENDAVVLARIQVRATDELPGGLWLRPATRTSVQGAGPAIAVDGEVVVARVTSAANGAAASVNAAFEASTPSVLAVNQLRAVPNPFNPKTDLRFALERQGRVLVRIFDVSGRLVRDLDGGALPAGPSSLTWSGQDNRGRPVTSGIYFARLFLDGAQVGSTEKLTLLK